MVERENEIALPVFCILFVWWSVVVAIIPRISPSTCVIPPISSTEVLFSSVLSFYLYTHTYIYCYVDPTRLSPVYAAPAGAVARCVAAGMDTLATSCFSPDGPATQLRAMLALSGHWEYEDPNKVRQPTRDTPNQALLQPPAPFHPPPPRPPGDGTSLLGPCGAPRHLPAPSLVTPQTPLVPFISPIKMKRGARYPPLHIYLSATLTRLTPLLCRSPGSSPGRVLSSKPCSLACRPDTSDAARQHPPPHRPLLLPTIRPTSR